MCLLLLLTPVILFSVLHAYTATAKQPRVRYNTNLSNGDVLELGGEGEDAEELDLAEGGLQELVVGGHGLVGEVVVAGDTAEVCHLVSVREGGSEGRGKRNMVGSARAINLQCSLKPRASSPRFYLAALEKSLQSCEMKSGRGRPGFKAILSVLQDRERMVMRVNLKSFHLKVKTHNIPHMDDTR